MYVGYLARLTGENVVVKAGGARLANFAFFVAKKFGRGSLFRLAARLLLQIGLVRRVVVKLVVATIDGDLAFVDDSG